LLRIEASIRRRTVEPAHAVDGLAGERHGLSVFPVHPVVAADLIVRVQLLRLADLVQHVGHEAGAAILRRRRVVEGERAPQAVAAMDRADLRSARRLSPELVQIHHRDSTARARAASVKPALTSMAS
jgi:hypothetical protein